MGDHTTNSARTRCVHCGQFLGFEKKEPWRKMHRIVCPICKKTSWVRLDDIDKCLFRLAEYEQSGMEPVQIAALSILYDEAKKIPELSEMLNKWESALKESTRDK